MGEEQQIEQIEQQIEDIGNRPNKSEENNSSINYTYSTLSSFLKHHTYDKNDKTSITHTKIGNNGLGIFGKCYSIPKSHYEEFMYHYKKAIGNNDKLFIVEKQPNNFFAIDIDFRYDNSITERQHTRDHIIDIVMTYNDIINQYVNADDYYVFVMEKPNVNVLNDKTKDGIHIIWSIGIERNIQKQIREDIIRIINDNGLLNDLPMINTIDDVFDYSITSGRNNWLLYGSQKPTDKCKYEITNVFNIQDGDINDIPLDLNKHFNFLFPQSNTHKILQLRDGIELMDKHIDNDNGNDKSIDKRNDDNGDKNDKNIDYNYFENYYRKIPIKSWDDTNFCAGFIRRWSYTKDETIKKITHLLLQQSPIYNKISSSTNMTGKEWCNELWDKYSIDEDPSYRGDIRKFYIKNVNVFCPIFFNNIEYKQTDNNNIKEIDTKITEIDNKIKEIEKNIDDYSPIKKKRLKLEMSNYRQQIRDLNKEISKNKEFVLKETFILRKDYFEKFHSRVKDGNIYIYESPYDMVIYKEKDILGVYNNLFYYEIDKKNEIKQRQFIPEWLKQINIRHYERLDYLPTPLYCPPDVYNSFKGINADELPPVDKSIDYDYEPILEHLKILVNYDEPSYKYLIRYLSHMLKKTGEKPNVALVFKSDQGVGKNLFFESFGDMFIGSDYLATDNIEHLVGKFNMTGRKIMIILDEANGRDTFTNNDKIKALITQNKVKFEKKGKDAYELINCVRLLIFSNNDSPVKIEKSDRRFVVFEACNKYANNKEYFDILTRKLKNKNVMRAFYDYLMEIDINDWNITGERPITDAYIELQKVSIPSLAYYLQNKVFEYNQVCEELDNEGDEERMNVLIERKKGMVTIDASKMYKEAEQYITENNLINYKYSFQKFGRDVIKYNGIEKNHTRTGNKYEIKFKQLEEYIKTEYSLN